ncbi:MAG: enoyl-CoA hydratase-related protein [Planctomycetaceae bacterium]
MSTRVELAITDSVARVSFVTENGVHVFSRETRAELARVLDELESSSAATRTLGASGSLSSQDLHAIVFQSEGRTFVAGADIRELAALDATTGEQVAREGQELMMRIERLRPVTLCAIHAACAGGGCELALACDMRIAAVSARIGLPEVSLGLLPGWGGTVRATRLFGGAVARRMILTGELFWAEEALSLGIVDAVEPDDRFRAAVDERLDMILARGPHAQRTVKGLIRELEGADDDHAFAREAELFGACCADAQSTEGTAAFLEKRKPVWTGQGE